MSELESGRRMKRTRNAASEPKLDSPPAQSSVDPKFTLWQLPPRAGKRGKKSKTENGSSTNVSDQTNSTSVVQTNVIAPPPSAISITEIKEEKLPTITAQSASQEEENEISLKLSASPAQPSKTHHLAAEATNSLRLLDERKDIQLSDTGKAALLMQLDAKSNNSGSEIESATAPKKAGRRPKRQRGEVSELPETAPPTLVTKASLLNRDLIGPIIYKRGEAIGDLEGLVGKVIQVYIFARDLTLKNAEVTSRHVWGSRIFTDDSDAVCMLIHTGSLLVTEEEPDMLGFIAYFKVLAGQESYTSSIRNELKSRPWSEPQLASISVDRVETLDRAHLSKPPILLPQRVGTRIYCGAFQNHSLSTDMLQAKKLEAKNDSDSDEIALDRKGPDGTTPNQTSAAISLTLSELTVPAVSAATTKESPPNPVASKKPNIMADTVIMYNLANEICKKYTLNAVLDKGLDKKSWTSYRLKAEVLYAENNFERYELSRVGAKSSKGGEVDGIANNNNSSYDRYRWAQDLTPLKSVSLVVPLSANKIKILAEDLDWNEIEWSLNSCTIKGVTYRITKIFWRSIRNEEASNISAIGEKDETSNSSITKPKSKEASPAAKSRIVTRRQQANN